MAGFDNEFFSIVTYERDIHCMQVLALFFLVAPWSALSSVDFIASSLFDQATRGW